VTEPLSIALELVSATPILQIGFRTPPNQARAKFFF
jgi:hypothetical protein